MNRIFKSIVLVLVVFFLMPFHTVASRGIRSKYVSPSGETVMGENWLFVIGINDYEKWPKLETAVNDAKSLKNVLLDRYSFYEDNIVELYDDKANRDNIIEKMRYLAKNVGQDDSLVIFFAGHGHIDSITKEGSWIPVNSDMENSAAWVSNHDIKKYLSIDAINAKHILLISDSCFSGDFFRGNREKLPDVTSAVIKKAYTLTSRQAITSGGLEPVSDAGFGNNSVFSHFLIKTLKENTNPFLIPSELFTDIKAGVAENAEQFPQFGSLNGTGGQQGGELVFFLKQDTQLKDLSAAAAEKNKELERLNKLEHEMQIAKEKEVLELEQQKKELAALDAKIDAMKNRLGTTSELSNDSLKNMLAMVRQKEDQKQKLDGLKREKAKETANRQAEINRIKQKAEEKELFALKEDIRDYNEIVSSEFGKDMADSAWKNLVKKYPQRAKGIKQGDTNGLIGTSAQIDLLRKQIKKIEEEAIVVAVRADFYEANGKKMEEWQTGIDVVKKNNGIIKEVSSLQNMYESDLILLEVQDWGQEEILKNINKLLDKGKVIWLCASSGVATGVNRNVGCEYNNEKWINCLSAPNFANQFLSKFGVQYTTTTVSFEYTEEVPINFTIKMETNHPLSIELDSLLGYRQPYIITNNSNAKPIGLFKNNIAIALLETQASGGSLIVGGGSDYELFLGVYNFGTKKRDLRINTLLGNLINYTRMNKIKKVERLIAKIKGGVQNSMLLNEK